MPHIDAPILIQGESGTGKELLAKAIHAGSPRAGKRLIAVNCGAIPEERVEAELFGHVKGAYTGAIKDHAGYIEAADGSTLFLDEIGELPRSAQVKLLRVVQERVIQRIGSTEEHPADFRIVAATNRNLLQEVEGGEFREDLFHRLAVGVLILPPLRERLGDLNLLIDFALEEVNQKSADKPGWVQKKLSAGARNLLHQHTWPGNIRELLNTLSRAAIWTPSATIDTADVREALLPVSPSRLKDDRILNRPLGKDLDLRQLISEVAQHYLQRAMEEAKGNKSVAHGLVGLASATTLTNWLKKYGLDE